MSITHHLEPLSPSASKAPGSNFTPDNVPWFALIPSSSLRGLGLSRRPLPTFSSHHLSCPGDDRLSFESVSRVLSVCLVRPVVAQSIVLSPRGRGPFSCRLTHPRDPLTYYAQPSAARRQQSQLAQPVPHVRFGAQGQLHLVHARPPLDFRDRPSIQHPTA